MSFRQLGALLLAGLLSGCATAPPEEAQIALKDYKGRLLLGRVVFDDPAIDVKELVFLTKDAVSAEVRATYLHGNVFVVAEAPNGRYFVKQVVLKRHGVTYSLEMGTADSGEWIASLSDHDVDDLEGNPMRAQIAFAQDIRITNLRLTGPGAPDFTVTWGYDKDAILKHEYGIYQGILAAKDLGPYRKVLTQTIVHY